MTDRDVLDVFDGRMRAWAVPHRARAPAARGGRDADNGETTW